MTSSAEAGTATAGAAYGAAVPELPEVQAHAERLESGYRASVLERFTPLTFTALKTATPGPDAAVGHPLAGVGRRGKFLLLRFEDAPTFVVHLMQGGRLVPDTKQAARPRNGIARWRFDDGTALLLTEAGSERKAGVWVLDGDPLTQPPLDALGPEADALSVEELSAVLARATGRLHGVLRDQHRVAGLGRMLANEICHRARLSPFATASKLSAEEVDRLHGAVTSCIADALAHERTLDAMSRAADRPGAVHRRKGAACPVCGDTVRAVEYRAYEVDYCPTCQTGGRVLADNTTSKFLK
jgi:formamidopyrimidine-DNA glycosylase